MRKKKICYFCGNLATTKEHLPPKQMFKGFECDSITVPSCKKHNCSKGGVDQAIVSTFLMPFKNNLEMSHKINPIVEKAVLNSLPSFERTKYKVESRQLMSSNQNLLKDIPEVGFIKGPISIKDWIKHLTAGLVFDALKYFDSSSNWYNIESWSPQYIPSKKNVSDIDKLKSLKLNKELESWFESINNWQNGWSAYPSKYPKDIYHFYISINKEEIIFKHIFYNSYNWYSWFKYFNNVKEKIQFKLNA